MIEKPIAIDLFAGAGGASLGLANAGFDVVGAVENDPDSAETYRLNHSRGHVFEEDIQTLSARRLMRTIGVRSRELDLLKACPPCQGFSTLRGAKTEDPRNDLVKEVARLVRALLPRSVVLENVPGLKTDSRFVRLLEELQSIGYRVKVAVVDAADFGVPQRRKRLIILAVRGLQLSKRLRSLDELLPASERRRPLTAGEALSALAGESRDQDPLNKYRKSSALVARRIAAVPKGGNRFSLPADLRLECHERLADKSGVGRRSAAASYGRVKLDQPAPTMTTRCTTPACGSFIHPTENRGLTLREAAYFQTFPVGYDFVGYYESVERQIGNALPVWLGEATGLAAMRVLSL